jgi:hypothetical protein
LNLSIPHRENRVQIIDVGENKVQVSDPAGAPQEIDAPAAQASIRRRVAPSADKRRSFRIFGKVPFAHQSRGDPGAAYLVFLPELTQASRADDGHMIVTFG